MAETQEERRKRILAEREARQKERQDILDRREELKEQRQKQRNNPLYRKYIIYKQKFSVKYYEITQNTKNFFSKYTSKQFWQQKKIEAIWTYREYVKFFKDIKKEIQVNIPRETKASLAEFKDFLQTKIYNTIGYPKIHYEQITTNLYLKSILFNYDQTLLNIEWVQSRLEESKLDLTHTQIVNTAKYLITQAGFNAIERNRSLYDLMVAVNKEREIRKLRELDLYFWGSADMTHSETEMRKLEKNVDANLNEWRDFLKNFK